VIKIIPLLEIDSFGTPPAARSSMMCVAGEEENDQDELLTDEGDDTIMNGPVYDEGKVIRIRLGELRKLIRFRFMPV
jgi:hypothetical protein